ncbi:hypothetical protein [Streptomyces afghaniensis]|uniref:hypothetical protein n=1 Tax=Streptomyces afghaniensis TaxID=66865 RepID=UPI0037B988DB
MDRAERDLGLTLGHHHTGIVLWRPDGATGPWLNRVAAQFADRLPGATLLTVTAEGDRLWAWLSRALRPGDREREALPSVRHALAGTRAVIGPSAPGTDGFGAPTCRHSTPHASSKPRPHPTTSPTGTPSACRPRSPQIWNASGGTSRRRSAPSPRTTRPPPSTGPPSSAIWKPARA